ncbi:MAG TPA: hypothetical protein VFK86_06170 [Bauldia sp.]|nr:hypothetical protein [Bauldia sp.]
MATLRIMGSTARTGETPVREFFDKRVRGAWPSTADPSLSGHAFFGGELGIAVADFPAIADWRERMGAPPGSRHPYQPMPATPLPEKS